MSEALSEWSEPDPVILEYLVGWAVPGADALLLSGKHFATMADATAAAVRAAIRLLLANDLVEAKIPAKPEETWVCLDPPGGW